MGHEEFRETDTDFDAQQASTKNRLVSYQVSNKNKIRFALISWPFRYNLLSSLQRDSSVVNLYDIQHTMVGNEEVEPSVLERVIVPGSPHNITSYSWHSRDENRFLTIALSGK